MSEAVQITGAGTLKVWDALAFLLFIAPRRMLLWVQIYAALYIAVLVLVALWHSGGSVGLLRWYCYSAFHSFTRIFVVPLIIICGTAVLGVIFDAVFQTVKTLRTPTANLKISYAIDRDEIGMSDEAGFSRKIPWKGVDRYVRFLGIFILRVKPKYWNYLPVRAFSVSDQEIFAQIAAGYAKR
jgi:hypothetical protein